MRKAFVLVVILLLALLPYVSADDDSIHLWSEQAPGAILLWDDSGNLTPVDPDLPIDLHLPQGNWTMVRLIDGVPQDQGPWDRGPNTLSLQVFVDKSPGTDTRISCGLRGYLYPR